MTARAGRYGDDRPRSLALVLMRDGLVLLGGAALVIILGRVAPIESQLAGWLVAALALGLAAGVIGGASGFVFLLAGMIAGVILDLATRHPETADAIEAIAGSVQAYAAALLVALAAFVIARLVKQRVL